VNDELTLENGATLEEGTLELINLKSYAVAKSSSDLTFTSSGQTLALWIYPTAVIDNNIHSLISKAQTIFDNNGIVVFYFLN